MKHSIFVFLLSTGFGLSAQAAVVTHGAYTNSGIYTADWGNSSNDLLAGDTYSYSSYASGPLSDNRNFSVQSSANLATGELKAQNQGTGGPSGGASNSLLITNSIFVDTLQFNGTYSEANLGFSANAHFSINVPSVPVESWSRVTAYIILFDTSLQLTDEMLSTAGGINNILYNLAGPDSGKRLYYNELTSNIMPNYPANTPYEINLSLADDLLITGTNRTIGMLMGLTTVVSGNDTNAAWNVNGMNTASITFDFSNFDSVSSSSSVFPGTTGGFNGPTDVPLPGAVSILALGLLSLAWRRRY